MENQNNNGQPAAKSNKTKWMLLGLGLLTTGAITVFSYQHWKKGKAAKTAKKTLPPTKEKQSTEAPAPSLKEKIKNAFKALNLKRKKPGTSKDAGKTSASKTAGPNKHSAVRKFASTLHKAASEKNFEKVSDLLKTIKTPAEYSAANKYFSLNGIRASIVSKLESTFNTEEQKQSLKDAFTAIGLKYNGKKWSLSGISEKPLLITTRPSTVWRNPETPMPVPNKMVLGREIDQRGDFTVFENDHQYFLVKTQDTRPYTKN